MCSRPLLRSRKKRGSRRTFSLFFLPSSAPGCSDWVLVLMLEAGGNQGERDRSGRCVLSRLLGPMSGNARNQIARPGLMGSNRLGRITCSGHPDLGHSLSSESHECFEKRAGSFSVRLLCSTADTSRNFDHATHHVQMLFVFSTGIFRIT